MRSRFDPVVVLIGICVLLGACSDRAPLTPIVVVGVDGLEWDILIPLLEADRLPNIGRLMQGGRYGELTTMKPTRSPVIWTTVATGKSPSQHGIHHFVRQDPERGTTLFTSSDRRTKALWNIASDFERRVNVVGWWMTWPAEPIEGVMVAQTNTAAQIDTRGGLNIWKGALREDIADQVYPASREARMLEVLSLVEADLPARTLSIFGEFEYPLSALGQRLWDNCQWAFRADATYLEIGLELAREEPGADLTMIYFGGPDVVGHRFWRYYQPTLYQDPPTAEQVENLGGMIEGYYVYIDRALGRLVAAHAPETTFMVLSDHGMHPVNQGARFDADSPPADVNSAHHMDAPPGVLIVSGPAVATDAALSAKLERSDIGRLGSIYDVAPTILALLAIPLGEDLGGRVLTELFDPAIRITDRPTPISTHDTLEFLESRGSDRRQSPGEEERMQQLRSLGYVD